MKHYSSETMIEKGKSISMFSQTVDSGFTEKPHTHDFIEIIYILSGDADQTVDKRSYSVKRGDMVFINYGNTHSFTTAGGFTYTNICFSPEVVANSIITQENAFSLLSLTAFNEMCGSSSAYKLSFNGPERQEIENILEAMLSEQWEGAPMNGMVLECYMTILITKMLRKTSFPMPAEELDGMWNELVDYIDNNLGSKLTLSHLASKCFYNPSYFSRIFKEKFKMPLTEYINRKRIDSASRLLLDPELSIEDVYVSVGFSERSSFSSVFQKFMGCTPSEYRKHNVIR